METLNALRDSDPLQHPLAVTRRHFLSRLSAGLGVGALSHLLGTETARAGGVLPATHFPARAKRVIYLHMIGAPSHLDLFDHKPLLNQRQGEQLPDSVRGGQRLTGSAAQAFLGSTEGVDPEEALVVALSSCHMLTLLAIAAGTRHQRHRH